MPGYVYLIHFNDYLHHARHYLGCTPNVLRRLTAHAKGHGSRLCKALKEEGIEWKLGALGSTTLKNMRKLERTAKAWKSAGRFCEYCSECPLPLPGTTPISTLAIPFDSRSYRLAVGKFDIGSISVWLTQARDIDLVLPQAVALTRENTDELGFIPIGGPYSMRTEIANGQFCVAFEGEQKLVGHAYFTQSVDRKTLTIQQCVVAEEYRGSGIGRKIVEEIARNNKNSLIQCNVRDDLPANEFWKAIGCMHIAQRPHKTSGNLLNLYHYPHMYGAV